MRSHPAFGHSVLVPLFWWKKQYDSRRKYLRVYNCDCPFLIHMFLFCFLYVVIATQLVLPQSDVPYLSISILSMLTFKINPILIFLVSYFRFKSIVWKSVVFTLIIRVQHIVLFLTLLKNYSQQASIQSE